MPRPIVGRMLASWYDACKLCICATVQLCSHKDKSYSHNSDRRGSADRRHSWRRELDQANTFITSMQRFEKYQELARYMGWSPEDLERIRTIKPLVAPHFVDLIDDFYAEIERHPEASSVITGGTEQIARLKEKLRGWLDELLTGPYDFDYVERRWRVGKRHVEIGLSQIYTNAAISRLRRGLQRVLEAAWKDSYSELLACRNALNTLLDLDLAIVEDAYQTEYQRRQAVAERLATIGKVAGGIGHELRNPLSVIKTSIYYLLKADNASEEKRKAHLERIGRQVDVATQVITALNDFARLPQPVLEAVPVQSCLREAIELNPLPRVIEVDWDFPNENLAMYCDPAQLEIVFGNLIRNARDAMPDGGVLSLRACRDQDTAAIVVRDSGNGIPADVLPYIFEPLYTTKAKGIGLGLSISRDIVERHQGTITVTSQPHLGTTVTLRLPAAP